MASVQEIYDELIAKITLNNPDRDLSDVKKAYEIALGGHGN